MTALQVGLDRKHSNATRLEILDQSGPTSSPKLGPPEGSQKSRGFPRPDSVTCLLWQASWPSSTPGSENFRRSSPRCGSGA
jgi:hypothetical protein